MIAIHPVFCRAWSPFPLNETSFAPGYCQKFHERSPDESTTHSAAGGIRGTEGTEKYSTEKGYYRIRNSGDSVPDTHRRFAWCTKHLSIPKGCELTGYGRLPISGQSPHKALLGVLCVSSEAGGE